jgi:hypothetical protein
MAKYGCDKCGLYFEGKEGLDEHAARHTKNSMSDPTEKNDDSDDRESMLLKRTMEEEKARKRTRGPYRKSATS